MKCSIKVITIEMANVCSKSFEGTEKPRVVPGGGIVRNVFL